MDMRDVGTGRFFCVTGVAAEVDGVAFGEVEGMEEEAAATNAVLVVVAEEVGPATTEEAGAGAAVEVFVSLLAVGEFKMYVTSDRNW